MKKLLRYLKHSVWVASLFGAVISAKAQKLQTQVNQQPKRGHAIYKQSKIYDSNMAEKPSQGDNAIERANYEFKRLVDPKTGRIPLGIRNKEVTFSGKISVGNDSKRSINTMSKSSKAGKYSYWKNRGPNNVGGRTRVLVLDRTNENIMFAGEYQEDYGNQQTEVNLGGK